MLFLFVGIYCSRRNGQPLGKSWETMSDYVAGINEEEAALFEEYKAAKAAAAAAAAAKE